MNKTSSDNKITFTDSVALLTSAALYLSVAQVHQTWAPALCRTFKTKQNKLPVKLDGFVFDFSAKNGFSISFSSLLLQLVLSSSLFRPIRTASAGERKETSPWYIMLFCSENVFTCKHSLPSRLPHPLFWVLDVQYQENSLSLLFLLLDLVVPARKAKGKVTV